MKLLLDVGNSRIKWGIFDNSQWLAEGVMATSEAGRLAGICAPIDDIDAIVGANVAGQDLSRLIDSTLSERGKPRWIKSSKACCGVVNLYDNPAQLGVDRWAALIAARSLRDAACLVVTAGTATTADVLDQHGVFQGGLIFPGDALMRSALAERTAQLPLANGSFVTTPRNTADAIASGCLNAQLGAVERMFELIADRPSAICLLNGGGAASLEKRLRIPTLRVDNLVLKGLAIIAADSDDESGSTSE